ncbi:MAG: sigma-70 family RNA polymerase sigma factor [Solirubrobacteraceae bacterium]
MTRFTEPQIDAPADLPDVPLRLTAGVRDRAHALALAADVARLHGEALLRTARRYSSTADDAHDAYQRALELLLEHAPRIDRAKAVSWMHVVVRREAGVLRRHHDRVVPLEGSHLDEPHQRHGPAPDEQLHAIDLAQRASEALAALKESEAQALCLRAQGMSYDEIADLYGWSYTKVNRAVTEGRKAFVDHYRAVESGVVCGDTAELIARYVAGDLKPRVAVKVRAHLIRCSGCRALLHAERGADTALRALLPPVFLLATESSRRAGAAGWFHDHLLGPIGHIAGRVQPLADHLTGAKLGVIAASTLALAGSGVAVEQTTHHQHGAPATIETTLVSAPNPATATATSPTGAARVVDRAIDRGTTLHQQAESRARARAAAAARRKRAAAKRKAAAKARAAGNAREFVGAAGEFTGSAGHTTTRTNGASTSARRSAATPTDTGTTQVDLGGGTDSTIDVTPEHAPASGASGDAVTNEFGN